MDADCLIKLTKAGLKELIASHETIMIPEMVRREVVDAGKAKGCYDAVLVEKNVAAKTIQIAKEPSSQETGDETAIATLQAGRYDAVATDDRKLIRSLKAANLPFVPPAVILYSLKQRGLINQETALKGLENLAPFISDEEYSTVRLLLEEKS